jgi:hypothetical protein
MAINYPKFDKKITDQIDDSKFRQVKNRPGTIMSYNSAQNTATVMVDEKFSSNIREHDTQCPLPVYLWHTISSPITRHTMPCGF